MRQSDPGQFEIGETWPVAVEALKISWMSGNATPTAPSAFGAIPHRALTVRLGFHHFVSNHFQPLAEPTLRSQRSRRRGQIGEGRIMFCTDARLRLVI